MILYFCQPMGSPRYPWANSCGPLFAGLLSWPLNHILRADEISGQALKGWNWLKLVKGLTAVTGILGECRAYVGRAQRVCLASFCACTIRPVGWWHIYINKQTYKQSWHWPRQYWARCTRPNYMLLTVLSPHPPLPDCSHTRNQGTLITVSQFVRVCKCWFMAPG